MIAIASPHRRGLVAAAIAASLLLASCSSSGGGSDDGAQTTTTAADATTTAAPTDEEPAEEPADEPAEEPEEEPAAEIPQMTIGDVLYLANPADPTDGGWPVGAELEFDGTSIVATIDANSSYRFLAMDEQFTSDVQVSADFDVARIDSTPDITFGPTCRVGQRGGYVGLLEQVPGEIGRYAWSIQRSTPEGFEVLASSGPDDLVEIEGAQVTMGISCTNLGTVEVLDLLVGSEYVGQAIDEDAIRGPQAGIFYQTADFGGPLHVAGFRVFELVPA
jgi:hypothetical protein